MYRICIKMEKRKYIITKKIAKHGNQSIIVIPEVLSNKIKPGNLAQITIDLIEDSSTKKDIKKSKFWKKSK